MGKFKIGKIFGTWTSPDGQKFVMAETEVDIYHNKGEKYLSRGRYEKAIKMFKKEIKCIPESGIGYHSLGRALQAAGKKQEARGNYQIALKKVEEENRRYPGSIAKEAVEEIKQDLVSLGG